MALTYSSMLELGTQMPNFELENTVNNEIFSSLYFNSTCPKLVMFICNHCPYVLAILDRIVRDASDLQKLGVGIAAISSNDVISYPEDSFDNMKKLAAKHNFTFPYMYDETQEVAKLYNAVCTPDFFGFNKDHKLQYRGRLDASRKEAGPVDLKRDLFEAMKGVAQTGEGPSDQIASMGCSIKWKVN